MTTVNSNRPAFKRRIAIYDLNDKERELLKQLADEDNRTVSRWVSDAVRERMRAKSRA